jgi:hypothetical protein
VGQLRLRVGILMKPRGRVGLSFGRIAPGIKRRLAACRRGQGQLGAGVAQCLIRRGEFLEPEAGLLASVAKFIVRSEHNQYLHDRSYLWEWMSSESQ